MSTRPNALKEAMLGVQQKPATIAFPTPVESSTTPRSSKPPSRVGKRSIAAHFEPTVGRQLRIMAAESDRTVQDLLAEALNDLFRKYAKSAIAP